MGGDSVDLFDAASDFRLGSFRLLDNGNPLLLVTGQPVLDAVGIHIGLQCRRVDNHGLAVDLPRCLPVLDFAYQTDDVVGDGGDLIGGQMGVRDLGVVCKIHSRLFLGVLQRLFPRQILRLLRRPDVPKGTGSHAGIDPDLRQSRHGVGHTPNYRESRPQP